MSIIIASLFGIGYFDKLDKYWCNDTQSFQQCKSVSTDKLTCTDNNKVKHACKSEWTKIIVDIRPTYTCDLKDCVKQ